jgi:serine O-acetyltransferase
MSASAPRRRDPETAAEERAPAAPPPRPEGEAVRPVIPSFAALRAQIREDRTINPGLWSPGFQALATHRLGAWSNGIRNRPLRAAVRLVHRFLAVVVRNVYGIEISERTHIGRRLRIAHQNGIVIHGLAVIGDDCLIRQGVTLGALGGGRGTGRRPPPGAPRLGDRVEIGVGAVLAGPIRVDDDVVIGPNAVVMTNVPAGAIVASPQSRIVAPPPRRDGPRK